MPEASPTTEAEYSTWHICSTSVIHSTLVHTCSAASWLLEMRVLTEQINDLQLQTHTLAGHASCAAPTAQLESTIASTASLVDLL
jgi:hypothetical protein